MVRDGYALSAHGHLGSSWGHLGLCSKMLLLEKLRAITRLEPDWAYLGSRLHLYPNDNSASFGIGTRFKLKDKHFVHLFVANLFDEHLHLRLQFVHLFVSNPFDTLILYILLLPTRFSS